MNVDTPETMQQNIKQSPADLGPFVELFAVKIDEKMNTALRYTVEDA